MSQDSVVLNPNLSYNVAFDHSYAQPLLTVTSDAQMMDTSIKEDSPCSGHEMHFVHSLDTTAQSNTNSSPRKLELKDKTDSTGVNIDKKSLSEDESAKKMEPVDDHKVPSMFNKLTEKEDRETCSDQKKLASRTKEARTAEKVTETNLEPKLKRRSCVLKRVRLDTSMLEKDAKMLRQNSPPTSLGNKRVKVFHIFSFLTKQFLYLF